MSRSKTRYTTTDTFTNGTRVATVNATPRVRPVVLPSLSTFNYPLILLEDRRTFHPDGQFRLPASRYRSDVRLVPKGSSHARGKSRSVRSVLYSAPPVPVGFARPDRVAICVRRKIRRQVIFASGVGGGKVRRGKRTYKSGFHCN